MNDNHNCSLFYLLLSYKLILYFCPIRTSHLFSMKFKPESYPHIYIYIYIYIYQNKKIICASFFWMWSPNFPISFILFTVFFFSTIFVTLFPCCYFPHNLTVSYCYANFPGDILSCLSYDWLIFFFYSVSIHWGLFYA